MSEYDFFLNRIEDMAMIARRDNKAVFSDFIDPAMELAAGREIGRYKGLNCAFFGGQDYSERKIMSVFPDNDEPAQSEYPLTALKSETRPDVKHGDILGAILGLQIDRNRVGDINILDDYIQLFVSTKIKDFIINELTGISKYNIKFNEISLDEVTIVEPEFKELNIIVPSLRLDAVIGNVFKMSRNEANGFVKGGKVKINHKYITKPSFTIKIGDLISVRTKGRAIIDSENGTTKKGNMKILAKKFV